MNSDLYLVEQARRGDKEAFSYLMEKYEKKVFSLALRICGQREEAEDLAQEIFLKVYQKLKTYQGEAAFSTWLYRVAANTCYDRLRQLKRDINQQLEYNEKIFYKNGMNPEEEFFNRQEILNLEKALMMLPEDLRLILLLREQYGLRYEEIAKTLSLNLGTVKTRIFRARERLRKILMQQEKGGVGGGM